MLFLPKHLFRGGVHPLQSTQGGKLATRDVPIRAFVPETVALPVNMHLGAPSKPCVEAGARVRIGEVVAAPVGARGLPVHASVSGRVTAVEPRPLASGGEALCVVIENDFRQEWAETAGLGDVESCDPGGVLDFIRAAGICGMGGAGFPTYAKLKIPDGKRCEAIIINGAECETFLTADHRLMLEAPARVVDGLRAVMRALGVSRGVIALEDNKPEAAGALETAARGRAGVEMRVFPTKYPQGGEKQLIEAVTGRQVPFGALPIDVQVVVLNAGTAAAIAEAVVAGKPLVERVVTVTGCVKNPSNLLSPIGAPIGALIAACGGYARAPGKLILGGGLTGLCAAQEDVPLSKTDSGVVVLDEAEARGFEEEPCIRCARCVDVCPMGLRPYLMKVFCDAGDFARAKEHDVLDCILCGACSYVCPARRQLTSSFKIGRDGVLAAQRRKKI